MFTRSRPTLFDRRDEILLAAIALFVPLTTLPALLGL